MKKAVSFILSLALILMLSACNFKEKDIILYTDTAEPHTFKYSEGVGDYGYYDIGSCRKLVGEVYTLVIFLNDKESSWDEASINDFYNKKFFPSYNYILDEAKIREVPLTLDCGQYSTKSDGKTPLYYNGIIETNPANAVNNLDIIVQTAKVLGFSTPEIMHNFLKNNTGCEQIAYILAVNKMGQAYAVPDSSDNGQDATEFVVAFSSSSGSVTNVGSTVVHELLHIFGATDLYDPTGEYPSRKKLAKKLYPRDIMMLSAYNPSSLEFGQLTSYLIGWTTIFPAEVDCPEWWSRQGAEPLPDREPFKKNESKTDSE